MSDLATAAAEVLDRPISTLVEPPARLASSESKPATDHLFVSNIRFLSMAAVVFIHCISGSFSMAGISPAGWLARVMRQPVEFDVIGFFLISGFLMEEGLTRRSSAEYLARRLRRIFVPWLFWYSLYITILLAIDAKHGQFRLLSWGEGLLLVLQKMSVCLFSSAYWFVPNLLFALCILLACRRFLFDLRMGCILLALSLFYGLNSYTHWAPVQNHNEALFGFIFYMWLGAWGARNFAAFQKWIEHISIFSLLAMAVLAGVVALFESSLLAAAGSPNPLNVLRISNQVYSIVVVLAILKLHTPIWPRVFNVRATTYGIYLIHIVVLLLLAIMVKHAIVSAIGSHVWSKNPAAAIFLLLGVFAVVYSCSLAVTRWLLGQPRLRWMVGAPRGPHAARPAGADAYEGQRENQRV